jgi:FAS-associated factor 2
MTEDENSPSASSSSGGVRQRRTASAASGSSSSQQQADDHPQPQQQPRLQERVGGYSDDESGADDGGVGSNSSSDNEGSGGPGPDRDLSPLEVDKLVQLQDMTGIDDLQVCRALLESKEWDLEATVMSHMNIPTASEQRREEERNRPLNPLPEVPNARMALNNTARVRALQQGAAGGREGGVWARLFDWGFFLLMLPVTVPYRFASTAFSGIYSIVAVIFGLPALPGGAGGRRPAVGHAGDPTGDVRLFKENFESKYGAVHPAFHPGAYSQVLDEAKRELKFLLVYLHCSEHQDADRFCSRTLSSSVVVDFVSANGILFWGCSVDTSEGYRVSQALRESTYPFLAVIVLRQNRMMVVGRVEGHVEAEPLVLRLEALVRDNEAYIVAARTDREERSRNQSIREEQDRAFQDTLRQDQEKERKRTEEAEKKRKEEEEEERIEREEVKRKENIRKRKIDLASEIPEEPEAGSADVVRVLVKLPGGQRLERRFLKSHSLKYLYFYVFCHPESPDEFAITTNFPKKVIECCPLGEGGTTENPPSFEEAGLGTSTMLFVNDLEA